MMQLVLHVRTNKNKSNTNIRVNEIAKSIIRIALLYLSHNIVTIFGSSFVYITIVLYARNRKFNEVLLNECTKHVFFLDNGTLSKK